MTLQLLLLHDLLLQYATNINYRIAIMHGNQENSNTVRNKQVILGTKRSAPPPPALHLHLCIIIGPLNANGRP
jgi:hypothetical protein